MSKTVECFYCKETVKEGASICPHCRKNPSSEIAKTKVWVWIVLCVVAIIMFVQCQGDIENTKNSLKDLACELDPNVDPMCKYRGISTANEREISTVNEKVIYIDLKLFTATPKDSDGTIILGITLEAENVDTSNMIYSKLSQIRTSIHEYLSNVSVEDFRGSAALHKLRVKLIVLVNTQIAPRKIGAILFREVIVE